MRFVQTLMIGTALIASGALAWAQQEPEPEQDPNRGVARVSLINGDATIQRGDTGERSAAAVNAPLVAGDSVITGMGGRLELQFDNANMLRVASDSEARLAEVAATRYHVEVARGTVMFSLIRDSNVQVEIDTPSVSVRPTARGAYRVTVFDDGRAEITTRMGRAEIYTPHGAETLDQGNTMMVRGSAQDPEFQVIRAPEQDEFDRWSWSRDQNLMNARSEQYVGPEMAGAGDLDANGRWVDVAPYGQVWTPTVEPGWAPYSNGRWVWTDFYGWTWVDYDPWGWAPFHYGRWFWGAGYGWCWYPGPRLVHPYWSPALVAFFGFGGFHVGIGFGGAGFGWVPLAPFEPLHAWWGRGFYGGYGNRNVFVNNIHVVNNVNITNVYRNARVANGVSVVNSSSFGNGRLGPITRASAAQLSQASLVRGPVPIAPTANSLRVSDRAVTALPRGNTLNRSFFTHTQPAPIHRVPFAQQQQTLAQVNRPGSVSREVAGRNSVQTGTRAPAPAASTAQREVRPPSAPAASTAQREVRPPAAASNTTGGWRRFNEPAPRTAAPQASNGRPSAPSSGSAWRQPNDRPSVNRSEPSVNRSVEPRSTPGYRSAPSDGWRRFQPPSSSYSSGSYRSEPRSQVQVAPPIVRERSTPRYEPRGSYSAPPRQSYGGYSAPPERSAPRYEPRYSTPSREYSAPPRESYGGYRPPAREYSAPSRGSYGGYSAPSRSGGGYSAPSHSSGGYSGGSHSSGYSGGHSSGGSSHSGGGSSGGGHHH